MIECDKSCLTCSGGEENNCLSCNGSLYLQDGRCVEKCSIGYLQNDQTHHCDPCPQNCLICSSGIFPFIPFFLSLFYFFLLYDEEIRQLHQK